MNRPLKDELLPEQNASPQMEASPQLPLSEEQMKEVVEIVLQDYQSAIDARNQKTWGGNEGEELTWDEKFGALTRLYEDQKATRPEKWMANRSLRIAMAIVEMMFAKLFPAVWNEDLVRWKPVEFTDQEIAERISKLMKWVVGVHMKLAKTLKSGIKYCIKYGNAIFEDKWAVKLEDKGETQPVPIMDEAGNPVLDEMGQPQIIQEPVLSVDEKCEVELIPLDKFLIQPGQVDIQKEPVIRILDYYYSDLELLALQGLAVNIEDVKSDIDSRILSDMDQAMEEAEKISKVSIRRRVYPLEILKWFGAYDANSDGFPEECIFLIDRITRTYVGGFALKDLYPRTKRVKRPLTKLGFIERELAFYWIGVLEQVKPLADELDACINQIIDANTLAIMKWGFYDPTGDYEPETHTARPRAMYPVRNPSQNVYFPDLQIPIERLVVVIRTIMEFIERLTAASSYMMGKESEIVGGSGTATRTQVIASAAMERYAIPAENIRSGVAELLTNIFYQYKEHIEPGFESRILGEKGQPIFRPGELTQEAVSAEMDAYIAASTSMGDRNVELEISNWIYQNLMMNPLVAPSLERVYKVTERPLKAMGIDPEEILGKRPYSKVSDNPDDEHTMMREGREVHPAPQEQHLYHLTQHTNKCQDPELITWSQVSVALLEAHIQETQMMLNQMIQMMMKQGGQGGGQSGGQGGNITGPQTVQTEPGKGISTSGSPEPLANQAAGVAGPTAPIG